MKTAYVHYGSKFDEPYLSIQIGFYVCGKTCNFYFAQRRRQLWHNGFEHVVASNQMRGERERHMIDNECLRGVRFAIELSH